MFRDPHLHITAEWTGRRSNGYDTTPGAMRCRLAGGRHQADCLPCTIFLTGSGARALLDVRKLVGLNAVETLASDIQRARLR